jgi:hypothetical protein
LTPQQRQPNDGKDAEQFAVRKEIKKAKKKVVDKKVIVCRLGNDILNLIIRKTVTTVAREEYGTAESKPGRNSFGVSRKFVWS